MRATQQRKTQRERLREMMAVFAAPGERAGRATGVLNLAESIFWQGRFQEVRGLADRPPLAANSQWRLENVWRARADAVIGAAGRPRPGRGE